MKIKDEVALEELSKYGFELVNYYDQSESWIKKEGNRVIMRVVTFTRQLKVSSGRTTFPVLYRMIKDDIVELMEEE